MMLFIYLFICLFIFFRVLVLVPTRELGVQVYQVTKQLAQYSTIEIGLSVGGLELKVQVCMLPRYIELHFPALNIVLYY